MQIWTHTARIGWQRWRHAGPGLDAVADAALSVDQVAIVRSGPVDDDETLATIRVIRRLAGGRVAVSVGTEHPSACWRATVREAGVDRAILVPKADECVRDQAPPLEHAVELGDGICPELHVLQEPHGALSVCGRHHDRMVLTRSHFDRWCLARSDECPHRVGGKGG